MNAATPNSIESNQSDPVVEPEQTWSDDQHITTPYDPTKVQIDPKFMTVFEVLHLIRKEELVLQPEFQRNLVWDKTRQSRLIESLLLNIPLPTFYLDTSNEDAWLVVDGLQRLSTLDDFCNKNTLRLTGLEFPDVQHLKGKTFAELPRNFQRRIERTQLYFYVIKPGTPSQVKFRIFARINTGGMVLNPQEIRHSLYQGKATELLQQLAESEAFQRATDNSFKNSTRMDDQECILRYFAFLLTPYTRYIETDFGTDFDGLLIQTMDYINAMNDEEIHGLEQAFEDAMYKAYSVFQEFAFRKISKIGSVYSLRKENFRRPPINKALFEVWSVCLTKYSEEEIEKHASEIFIRFLQVLNDNIDYFQAITQGTGGKKQVQTRYEITRAIIEGQHDAYLPNLSKNWSIQVF